MLVRIGETAIFVRGGTGTLFFLTMLFQFSPAIQIKTLKLHKAGGRIALLSGYVMGLSAICKDSGHKHIYFKSLTPPKRNRKLTPHRSLKVKICDFIVLSRFSEKLPFFGNNKYPQVRMM